eukprot:TRINITY_DN43808_c0_g1_i1.p1 TRINITY_DN43808_c0_g1~~TRINITY_DN43808_c0_g1_i1.p1  ORF type:complete len:1362 (-),score=203.36 TRINITY_DN43808_c0_g1_i1:86-4171(-)
MDGYSAAIEEAEDAADEYDLEQKDDDYEVFSIVTDRDNRRTCDGDSNSGAVKISRVDRDRETPSSLRALSSAVDNWQAAGTPISGGAQIWATVRGQLKACGAVPSTATAGKSRPTPAQGRGLPHEVRLSLADIIWDIVLLSLRAASSRKSAVVPWEVNVGILRLCYDILEEASRRGSRRPASGGISGGGQRGDGLRENCGVPNSVLRLLAHVLRELKPVPVEQTRGLASNLLAATRTWSDGGVRRCSLIALCLRRICEQGRGEVKAHAREASSFVMESARCLGDKVATQPHHGEGPAKAGHFRDSLTYLEALPSLSAELKDTLEPSALMLLSHIQQYSAFGAPYVVRGIGGAVAASRSSGPPGLSSPRAAPSSTADLSELGASSGTGSCIDDASGGRLHPCGRDAGYTGNGRSLPSTSETRSIAAATALAAQCRAAALRASAQFFRIWPKTFFGRWPLVLDFSSAAYSALGNPSGLPLPMLIAIGQQDPVAKVRSSALEALCALLEAPGVRTWPVPLERGTVETASSSTVGRHDLRSGSATPAFTSLSGQVATTLRQSHNLVLALLANDRKGDVYAALRACSQLLSCTPYNKLRPGLMSMMVQRLSAFLVAAADADDAEQMSQNSVGAVAALSAALRREDCAEELGCCLYEGAVDNSSNEKKTCPVFGGKKGVCHSLSSQPSSVGCAADIVFDHALRLASDARLHPAAAATANVSTVAAAPVASPGTRGDVQSSHANEEWSVPNRRGGRASKGRGSQDNDWRTPQSPGSKSGGGVCDSFGATASERSDSATVAEVTSSDANTEPAVLSDVIALASRVAHLRPAKLQVRTRESLQSLVNNLLEQPYFGLRVRGCKILEDIVGKQLSPQADTDTAACCASTAEAPIDVDLEWCASTAHKMLAAFAGEKSAQVRSAMLPVMPRIVEVAAQGCNGRFAVASLKPHVLAAVSAGVQDAGATVRTTAAQTCGALARILVDAAVANQSELKSVETVLESMIFLTKDEAIDVRSAAATACASFAQSAAATAGASNRRGGGLEGTGGSGYAESTEPSAESSNRGCVVLGSLWCKATESMLVLCQDRSEKVRASSLRALGCLVEAMDLGCDLPESPVATVPSLPVPPPGLIVPPGLAAQKEPLLPRVAEALALGVSTPPPKCQWNACRAIGQVYCNPTLLSMGEKDLAHVHARTSSSLCNAVSQFSNMKVRIQATQALCRLPATPTMWGQANADAVIVAVCDALLSLEPTKGRTSAEEKQIATYLKTLLVELRSLAEHWAQHATNSIGDRARACLTATSAVLLRLVDDEAAVTSEPAMHSADADAYADAGAAVAPASVLSSSTDLCQGASPSCPQPHLSRLVQRIRDVTAM